MTDIICGIYSVVGILAALQHRHLTGRGQQVDLALLDTQVSWLANVGLQYLTSGKVPKRIGNEHPSIVPYSVVPCSDGFFILAVGNDRQFAEVRRSSPASRNGRRTNGSRPIRRACATASNAIA